MKGTRISYSQAELQWVKTHCTLPAPDLHKRFCERFNRYDVSQNNLCALRKRNGWRTGRTGHFAKGFCSHRGGPGGPNKTIFKKGSIPANRKPLYTERVSVDGYVEIKVPEKNPHTGAPTRYVLKHRWVWEKANGPVPADHVLKFKDGDKTNCDIENLELMHRGVLAILNKTGYDDAPEEVKPAMLTRAKLQVSIKHKLNPRNQRQGVNYV